MTYKYCPMCKQNKPANVENFARHKGRKDGWLGYCKPCDRQRKRNAYEANKEILKKKAAIKCQQGRHRNRLFVYNFLKRSSCIDCGDNRWQVLEFDHVRGEKRCGISEAVYKGFSLKNLQKEIDKCEVRCANCHRIKTINQMKWYQHDTTSLDNDLLTTNLLLPNDL